jgi:hypothetical protein
VIETLVAQEKAQALLLEARVMKEKKSTNREGET